MMKNSVPSPGVTRPLLSVMAKRSSTLHLFPAAASLLVGLAALTGCERTKPQANRSAVVPVTVARASAEDVPVRLEAIGSVQTISTSIDSSAGEWGVEDGRF